MHGNLGTYFLSGGVPRPLRARPVSSFELFRNLNRDVKQTIVMVSHKPWHTEYFDRVITLQDREIAAG